MRVLDNNHALTGKPITVIVVLTVTLILYLIPDIAVMAQTELPTQSISMAQKPMLQLSDHALGLTDTVWLIMITLGGFLYIVNSRSI